MKKTWKLISVCAMLAVLSACGGKKTDTRTGTDTGRPANTTAPTQVESKKPTATPEPPTIDAEAEKRKEQTSYEDMHGLMVLKLRTGDSYVYNSTGTYMCTVFTADIDAIDPETGEVTHVKTFSSKETHSCGIGQFSSVSRNTESTARRFSADMTKMAAGLTMEDGAHHVGWINENGDFTDVSAKVTVPSAFGALTNHGNGEFWGGYFYFSDSTNETTLYKRVPIDRLTPDAVEIVAENRANIVFLPDGNIAVSDRSYAYYYDETMSYAALLYFCDWISQTEYVGESDSNSYEMIYKYKLDGPRKETWDGYSERIALLPEIRGRKNWNPVVSPDGESVAFMSCLENSTNAPELFIVSTNGGEPVKVDTTYDFWECNYGYKSGRKCDIAIFAWK